jgi:hypothetical protein
MKKEEELNYTYIIPQVFLRYTLVLGDALGINILNSYITSYKVQKFNIITCYSFWGCIKLY